MRLRIARPYISTARANEANLRFAWSLASKKAPNPNGNLRPEYSQNLQPTYTTYSLHPYLFHLPLVLVRLRIARPYISYYSRKRSEPAVRMVSSTKKGT